MISFLHCIFLPPLSKINWPCVWVYFWVLCWVWFCSVYGFFCLQKFASLIRSNLFIFAFILFIFTLGVWPKKTLAHFISENVMLMFSSRSFVVTCLIFQSLVILSLFLYIVWNCVLISLIFFFFLASLSLSCVMWDLVPWPGIEPRAPAFHWFIHGFPNFPILIAKETVL